MNFTAHQILRAIKLKNVQYIEEGSYGFVLKSPISFRSGEKIVRTYTFGAFEIGEIYTFNKLSDQRTGYIYVQEVARDPLQAVRFIPLSWLQPAKKSNKPSWF